MRIVEIILIVLALCQCVFYRRMSPKVGALALSIATIGEIAVDSGRWQMLPVYIAVLMLIVSFVADMRRAASSAQPPQDTEVKEKQFKSFQRTLILFVLAGFALSALVPIVKLPQPTGKYEVGTHITELEDPVRKEIFFPAGKPRKFPLQIWYPTQPLKSHYAFYMQPSDDFASLMRAFPWCLLASHLHLISTHSFIDSRVAGSDETFPVIIMSHGLMGGRIQNTIQAEEFASHGYMVVALDHPYDAAFSIFPDGKAICSQLLTDAMIADRPTIKNDGFGVRLGDVKLVIDGLFRWNKSDPIFRGRIDTSRIGVMGHSFGGATAVQTTATEKNVSAGIDLDGGVNQLSGGSKPIMIIEGNRAGDPLGVNLFKPRQTGDFYRIKIAGAGHANFTDLPLLTPMHWALFLSGPISQPRCEAIINSYVLAFFDKYLRGQKSYLLEGKPGEYPEVTFESSTK